MVGKSLKKKKVKFTLEEPKADKVMLAGDFNNWKYAKAARCKNKKKIWEKDLLLKPGRYEYKFVVDGNWINDPKSKSVVGNVFGTENSIIEVK